LFSKTSTAKGFGGGGVWGRGDPQFPVLWGVVKAFGAKPGSKQNEFLSTD
jgi:hypothetical protein